MGPDRIILGGAFGNEDPALSFAKLDRFHELGGRLVETSYSYAKGRSKQIVGQWMKTHPDALGVVSKVGHDMRGHDIPLSPSLVTQHVEESLRAMNVEQMDIVMFHCDDPTRSVAELADTLGSIVDAGHARHVGVSNWPAKRLASISRVMGTERPPVASYHFSLASPDPRELAPLGLSAEGEILDAVRQHSLPLLSWSSQAQGFFARTPNSARSDDPFDTPVSRARRERCIELAVELETRPEAIALAWTLHQGARPTIGPSSIAQLEASFEALEIPLTASHVEWLRTGDGNAVR